MQARQGVGKLLGGAVTGAASSPGVVFTHALCNGQQVKDFVDCGFSCTMIAKKLVRCLQLSVVRSDVVISSVSGQQIRPLGQVSCKLEVNGHVIPNLTMLVLPTLPANSSLLIGTDVIRAIGKLTLMADQKNEISAQFGPTHQVVAVTDLRPTSVTLTDVDYSAHFDGRQWEVAWRWKDSVASTQRNQVAEYAVHDDLFDRYRRELGKWIRNGWLMPCWKPSGGIIPLLAVHHDHKDKVRPVLDYRELNQYVQSHTAKSEVCPETLRRWRTMGDQLGVIDLKDAYLQLRISREQQDYQVVRLDDQYYRLTRVGFGLASAPKIMSAIVAHVLAVDPRIAAATDHYVDDIIVDTTKVTTQEVIEQLNKYGLSTKAPETLDQARVLGLQLKGNGQGTSLRWGRGKPLPQVPETGVTRRDLFSICGKLVGHYPTAGWLRVACSYLKRCAEGYRWEDMIGSRCTTWLESVLQRVRENDPVSGW